MGGDQGYAKTLMEIFAALAAGARSLSELIALPAVAGRMGDAAGGANADGDTQRKLDLVADDLFRTALFKTPVRAYLSEEGEEPALIDPEGRLDLAIDPLDGSSNIDVIAPIGTIFSILPACPDPLDRPEADFRRPGRAQSGAGFFVYGSQTALAMSVGAGTHLLTLDRASGQFTLVQAALKIPAGVSEYAINASDYRHWHDPMQTYIDDCVLGAGRAAGQDRVDAVGTRAAGLLGQEGDRVGLVEIFDLDGTLIDSAPDIAAALNHALALENLEALPPEVVRAMIGDGVKALIRKALAHLGRADTAGLERRPYDAFQAYARSNPVVDTTVYAGMTDLLTKLKVSGVRLGVCTNKTSALAELIVAALPFAELIDVVTGKTGPMLQSLIPRAFWRRSPR